MQTLSKLADTLGISIGTVRNKINKYREATGINFYSLGKKDSVDSRKVIYPSDAVNDLLAFIDPTRFGTPSTISDPTIGADSEVVLQSVEVESGNHCVSLANPDFSGSKTLEPLRDSGTVVFDDPLSIAAQFSQLSKNLIQSMDSDIQVREQRLQEARKAQRQVQDAANELALETRLYRDRAHRIDAEQVDTTMQIQKSVEELQRLGKHQP